MEKEKKDSNILLIIIAIATLLVAIIGATFAYFSATSEAIQQDITTGRLNIAVTSTEVSQKNIKPTDFDGDDANIESALKNNDIAQLSFTVDPTDTTIDAYYSIYLTTTSEDKLDNLIDEEDNGIPSDINWALVKVTEGDSTTYSVLDNGTFGGDMTDYRLNTNPISITSPISEDKYILLIWIQENNEPQDNLQGLTLNATIKVEANQAAANLPNNN